MNVVVDTNVFVSGVLGGQNAKRAIDGFVRGEYRLVVTPVLIEELISVLARPQFAKVMREGEHLIEDIVGLAHFVEPDEEITACRDPKDTPFLEAAVAGQADVIVTGDADRVVRLEAGLLELAQEVLGAQRRRLAAKCLDRVVVVELQLLKEWEVADLLGDTGDARVGGGDGLCDRLAPARIEQVVEELQGDRSQRRWCHRASRAFHRRYGRASMKADDARGQ